MPRCATGRLTTGSRYFTARTALIAAWLLLMPKSAVADSEGRQSSTAELRSQFAHKLEEMINYGGDVRASVTAEGPDLTTLHIVRAGAFRPQFGSLMHPLKADLYRLGFKSLLLCTSATVCQHLLVPVGTDLAF